MLAGASFGLLLDGRAQESGIKRRGSDATLLLVYNAHPDVVNFTLIDTNQPEGQLASTAASLTLLLIVEFNGPTINGAHWPAESIEPKRGTDVDSTRKIRIGEAEAEKGSMKTVWIDVEEPWAGLEIAPSMKMTKAIRRQAATAERVAANTADAFVADQMKSLAQAFRTQPKSSRRTRRNELFNQSAMQGRRTAPPQENS
jgi:hypothetical protein